jgi:hypothetical protein
MNKTLSAFPKTLLTILLFIAVFYSFPSTSAANTTLTFQLLDKPEGTIHYSLNITIQQSLYDYYTGKSHTLNSINDFAKFVTPYALQPIANALQQIYTDPENLVNAVLMIVHQIPYQATTPPKYPVETLVNNQGDCDLLSYIAASLTKTAGLNTVLLYYETQAHMNIGVDLSQTPQDTRTQPYSITYNNRQYYMAECTGENWQNGWRIGESPDELKNVLTQIITLENAETWAPAQVSATFKTLQPSTLTLTLSSSFLMEGTPVTLQGQLTPSFKYQNITIYTQTNNSPWTVLDITATDTNGQYRYTWMPTTTGIVQVRTSWSGNNDYAAADSPTQTVTTLSLFFIALIIAVIILATTSIIIYAITRRNQTQTPQPLPPPGTV